MNVAGSVVLVTGATGGIGRAVTASLTGAGAQVLAHGRDERALDELRRQTGAAPVAGSLADADGVHDVAARAVAPAGRVDAVVHTAGIGWAGRFTAMPEDRLHAVLALDLYGVLLLTRLLLPPMVERGAGHVSIVGSIAGLTGVAEEAAYAAAKGGLAVFAESLRLELAGSGVGVSLVSPGVVATEFFSRRGTPYERRVPRPIPAQRVAEAVLDCMRHDRAERVVPRWLGVAPRVRAWAPGLYRRLAVRLG